MRKKRIYIICPVRKITRGEKARINRYVRALEAKGHEIRLPYRDTNQADEIGLRIVEGHEQDIIWADEIHIWWSNNYSEGRLWDFAQARMARRFMPNKKIILINESQIEVTRNEKGDVEKSYTNVLLATHFGLKISDKGINLLRAKEMAKSRKKIPTLSRKKAKAKIK